MRWLKASRFILDAASIVVLPCVLIGWQYLDEDTQFIIGLMIVNILLVVGLIVIIGDAMFGIAPRDWFRGN